MLEINQNFSRNFMSADENSWKVWENTLYDELTIDFGGVKPPQKTTPKDLMDWAMETCATVKTQHMLFNMNIHLDGNHATSKSYGHAPTSAQTTATSGTFMRFTSTSMCGRPTVGGFRRSR